MSAFPPPPARRRSGSSEFHDQGVERDRLLDIAAEGHGDLIDAGHGLAEPDEIDGGGEGLEFAANIEIADLRAAGVEQQEIAEEFVEHLEVDVELLAPAAADGFADGHPGGEGRGAGGGFQEDEHGGAA